MATTTVKTECSGKCGLAVTLNLEQGTATTAVPSNRKQGRLHVPAHTLVSDVVDTDGYLFMWDCPVDEYANSWTEDEGSD